MHVTKLLQVWSRMASTIKQNTIRFQSNDLELDLVLEFHSWII